MFIVYEFKGTESSHKFLPSSTFIDHPILMTWNQILTVEDSFFGNIITMTNGRHDSCRWYDGFEDEPTWTAENGGCAYIMACGGAAECVIHDSCTENACKGDPCVQLWDALPDSIEGGIVIDQASMDCGFENPNPLIVADPLNEEELLSEELLNGI